MAQERENVVGNTAALHQHNEDKQWSILIPLLQVTKLPGHSIPYPYVQVVVGIRNKENFYFSYFVMF